MAPSNSTRAGSPRKHYGELALQRLSWLVSPENPTFRTASKVLQARPFLWAVMGASLTFSLLACAGAIWGACTRPAPCYGGGEPSLILGAAFGMVVAIILLASWMTPIGALIGAAIAAFLLPDQLDRKAD